MKASAILALAGAAIVSAQSVEGLDDCSKRCATDLLTTSVNISCNPNDLACRCQNPNFLWGLLDCGQYCGDRAAAATWGTQQCAGINIPIASASASGTVTTPVASDVSVVPTAIATSTFTSVITSGTAVETVIGTTTISGVNGEEAVSSTLVPLSTTTATSALVSTVTSGSSTFVTTTGSSTFTTEVASTATDEGAESTATSNSSSAMGARETAAGFILAAGLAAALL